MASPRLISAALIGLGIGCAAPQTAAVAQTISTEFSVQFVTSGRETPVFRIIEIGDNCEARRGFNVRVDVQPAHGTVVLRKVDVVLTDVRVFNFLSAEQLAKVRNCLGRTVQAIQSFYTSRAGFVGADQFYLDTTSSGQDRRKRYDVRLSVR